MPNRNFFCLQFRLGVLVYGMQLLYERHPYSQHCADVLDLKTKLTAAQDAPARNPISV